jgi:hypothetical protein
VPAVPNRSSGSASSTFQLVENHIEKKGGTPFSMHSCAACVAATCVTAMPATMQRAAAV